MTLWLSLALLAASPPRDGLAPLLPGLASAGPVFDLVLRPEPGGSRLLLSDAETDAPIADATVTLQRFGKAGTKALAEVARAGQYEGHFLAEGPAPGEALVVEVHRASGSGDLFAFTLPAAPAAPVSPRLPATTGSALGLAALLAVGLWRRRGPGLLAALLAVGLLLGVPGDAAAHGADEAGLPIDPGAELTLGQEIQFALGLRTARVQVSPFAPPDGAGGAPRTSPAVPRSAVVERAGKKLVFVRIAPERFVAREVTLGWTSGAQVAIEAGLAPGELAVVSGGGFLRNGGARGP